jgi:hypothetical protein
MRIARIESTIGARVPRATPITAPPEPDVLSYLRTTVLVCAGFPALYGTPGFESYRIKLLSGMRCF